MSSLNKVILIGNLGKDPEVTTLTSGVKVAKFSLATTEKWTAEGGEKMEKTEWHNIVAWRGLSDVSEKYLKKGKQVYIEGSIQSRTWEDKETNVKKYATDIVASNIVLLGSVEAKKEEA